MRWPTLVFPLAVLLAVTACASGRTISGSYRDGFITDRTICRDSGSLTILLTDGPGKVIGRDSVRFIWENGACILPFSFEQVPELPGYGVKIGGLGGTTWLTPARAANPVRLAIDGL